MVKTKTTHSIFQMLTSAFFLEQTLSIKLFSREQPGRPHAVPRENQRRYQKGGRTNIGNIEKTNKLLVTDWQPDIKGTPTYDGNVGCL